MAGGFATLGYGFHLEESRQMLDAALEVWDRRALQTTCIDRWPQKSDTNKQRMWAHLSKRYLDFEDEAVVQTPFLRLYNKLRSSDAATLDLVFLQLCQTTPVVLETLRSLATDTLLNTGQAAFNKYHLDQLLFSIFGRVTKSTCERVRQILIGAGRMRLDGKTYVAVTGLPVDSVLGYGLYLDAIHSGWRAPSTQTLLAQSSVAPAFLCNRALLAQGLSRLAAAGHCDYHRHGQTDQILLRYNNLQEFVDACTI